MPETSSTSTMVPSPRATAWVQVLVALQWFVFMLASIITVPLVLGPALSMTPQQVARFTDQTLVVCGVLGLLQVCVGHRLPIVEGPAGMWWGVWTELINMARETGLPMHSLLQQLEFALLAGSVVYIALGALGWVNTVRRWFTAPVTGTFLVLLALQFSGPMVRGMLGLTNSARVQLPVAGVSLLLVVVTLWLSVKGPGVLRTVAVLVGMVLGWVLYALLGWLPPWVRGGPVLALPAVLPYGPPQPLTGIAVTAVMTMVILLSNLIAAVYATASAAGEVMEPGALRRGTLVSGLGTALAGLFGTPGMVPLASSASLVALMGVATRLPYALAAAGLVVIGLVPAIGQAFATLPEPVGYAVLFTVFAQLLGMGLRDYQRLPLNARNLLVISLSVMPGVGVFFIPSQAWAGLPSVLSYLLSNGLMVGVSLALLLEHGVFRTSRGVPGET